MKTDKNILVTGGGTGGHLYPAIAVIEYIRKKYPETSITFIGSKKGSGKSLISDMGVRFYSVRASGLIGGKNIFRKAAAYLLFFIDLIPGFFKSFSILKKNKIDIILGMGGYICTPVLLAAIIRKTAFVLHEQNYIPGRLNRLFSVRSRYFFTSFEDTKRFLNIKTGNIIFSGNPVRKAVMDFRHLNPDYKKWGLSEKRFTITALGGSLGARKINESVLKLGSLINIKKDIQVLLISGTRFYEGITSGLKDIGKRTKVPIKVFPYIDEIDKVYRITDLIISRAGASTVFEIYAAGIPSILIPYPFAIDDHQTYNARYLEHKNMSIVIEEKYMGPELLAEKINVLLQDNKKLYNMMKMEGQLNVSRDSACIISEKLMEDVFEDI